MTLYEQIKREKQAHAKLIHDARAVRDRAEEESRSLTAEERSSIDQMLTDATDKLSEIQTLEQLYEQETGLEDPDARSDDDTPEARGGGELELPDGAPEGDAIDPRDVYAQAEYRSNFDRMIRGNREARSWLVQHTAPEHRDVVSDDDEAGGFLITPQQFAQELIKELDDTVYIRQWARTFQVTRARALGAPKRTARANTFGWTAEVQEPTKDTALKFGGRVLEPHYLSGEIDVSNDWLRNALLSPSEIIVSEMNRDAGEVQEDAFMLGHGSQQPLGLYTPSADGISTARDTTAGSATALDVDDFINLKYSFKEGYWQFLRMLLHRNAQKQIAMLKSTTGEYIWRESARVGEPNRLLGIPTTLSERNPSTVAADQYVALAGDFRYYWIVDALDMELRRLVELEARKNLTVFIARMKVDAMPVLEEAFGRLKMAP